MLSLDQSVCSEVWTHHAVVEDFHHEVEPISLVLWEREHWGRLEDYVSVVKTSTLFTFDPNPTFYCQFTPLSEPLRRSTEGWARFKVCQRLLENYFRWNCSREPDTSSLQSLPMNKRLSTFRGREFKERGGSSLIRSAFASPPLHPRLSRRRGAKPFINSWVCVGGAQTCFSSQKTLAHSSCVWPQWIWPRLCSNLRDDGGLVIRVRALNVLVSPAFCVLFEAVGRLCLPNKPNTIVPRVQQKQFHDITYKHHSIISICEQLGL